jgi:hypothetical protein
MAKKPPQLPIFAKDFDIEKLKFLPITKTDKTTSSLVRYVQNGKEYEPLLVTHECRSSGIVKGWAYEMAEATRNDSNVKEFKLGLSLTTNDTADKPTEEQKCFIDVLDAIRLKVAEFAQKNQQVLKSFCPAQAGLVRDALEDKDLTRCVKPLYNPPTEKDFVDKKTGKKEPVKIPHKLYVKLDAINLVQYAKNSKYPKKGDPPVMDPENPLGIWKFLTTFRTPEKANVHPLEFIGVAGTAIVALRLRSIWFGGHGDQPRACNLQISCHSVNFTPFPDSFGQSYDNVLPEFEPSILLEPPPEETKEVDPFEKGKIGGSIPLNEMEEGGVRSDDEDTQPPKRPPVRRRKK